MKPFRNTCLKPLSNTSLCDLETVFMNCLLSTGKYPKPIKLRLPVLDTVFLYIDIFLSFNERRI